MKVDKIFVAGFLAFVAVFGMGAWAGAAAPAEQKTPPSPVKASNPYQGEVVCRLGDTVSPNVNVDGVVWRSLAVQQVGHRKLVSGKAIKTRIEVVLENTRDRRAKADIVLLFEDEQGNPLDRLELNTISVSGGAMRTIRQKVKIQADVLTAMRKIYLFAEITPHSS
ncbi:MAG: hypothetical protein GXP48_11600 [Acidobacteria bacterium]|nr:hypothetical protein [Acidobacteriota bacterium]